MALVQAKEQPPKAPWYQYMESSMLVERALEFTYCEHISDQTWIVSRLRDEMTPIYPVREQLGN